ncbi:hypothetical protein G7Y89_g7945 [Cudoniella acicularis]|uniref:DUF6594 domain-containing protein n=1 Tax=Cudoniella acicularis TaxID=354080 RepID=A0A8H4RHK0_9HELO|nr:hypothetical protein G7Y89_g7945 [Cudoniella acicularis]
MQQSGVLRSRGQPAHSATTVSASGRESTATPGAAEVSASNAQQTNHSVPLPTAAWQWLLAHFTNMNLFGKPTEATKNFNRQYGYAGSKLKYDKCKVSRAYLFDAELTSSGEVEDFPEGYPRLSAFMNADDSYANYRSFKRLSARILLHRQNELTGLENSLDALDREDAADKRMEKRLRGFDLTDDNEKVLMKAARLRGLGQSSQRDHYSVLNYVMNRHPFGGGKYDYVFHADDFVSLNQNSHKGKEFEVLVEQLLDWLPEFPFKNILQSPKEAAKTKDKFITTYSPRRLGYLANGLAVSLAVGVLLVPVYLLFLVVESHAMMAVTASIFMFAFSVILSAVTGASPQEIFMGAAAFVSTEPVR